MEGNAIAYSTTLQEHTIPAPALTPDACAPSGRAKQRMMGASPDERRGRVDLREALKKLSRMR